MMTALDDPGRPQHPGRWALYALLVLAFATGGSSQRWGVDDAIVQCLAAVFAAIAGWTLLQGRVGRLTAMAALLACAIAALPLLQLASIPDGLWAAPAARQQLAADLASVGVAPLRRWTLAPTATWHAWALGLPWLACFLGTLAYAREPRTQRNLLRLIVLLAAASMVLGALQMGVPRDSLLHPFPEWAPLFQGVFAHFNHQGTSVAIGLLLALSLWLGEFQRPVRGTDPRRALRIWGMGVLALFLLAALPLTTSRAAVTLAVVGVPLVLVAMRAFHPLARGNPWLPRAATLGAVAIAVFGVLATTTWLQVDAAQELRAPMRAAAAVLARAHAPLGTGIGGFVPAFAAAAPDALLLQRYINHAHNEYLQWWVEFGWVAVLAGLVCTCTLLAAIMGAIRAKAYSGARRDLLVGSAAVLCMVLAHSMVEYPLRTTSLASVVAVVAAILVLLPVTREKPEFR